MANYVGIIPAAGEAKRLAPLPFSKELYPIGSFELEKGALRPKPACIYLLEAMRYAGVQNIHLVIRDGKWDIPSYLGDGSLFGVNISYLMMRIPYGAPFSVNQAFPFTKNDHILFGFPDIIFEPVDAYFRLIERQEETQADVVLGLFPARNTQKMDMIKFDDEGAITDIVIKPEETDLTYTWILSVWSPAFSKYMYDTLRDYKPAHAASEYYVGQVFQKAMSDNFVFEYVIFRDGNYYDIGTTDELIKIQKMNFERADI